MSEMGHNSDGRLKAFVERIERVEQEMRENPAPRRRYSQAGREQAG